MNYIKKPFYDLEIAQSLIRNKKYFSSKRVRSYLLNHGYYPEETIEDVFCSMQSKHFYKSDWLHKNQGVIADIYRRVECYKAHWYVKFFIDNEEGANVALWSLKEDGYNF